ncbi:hypothetical protein A2U01_0008016 [Trifolium medium]|uniref:Retrotransposon gag domain-containing protein n=1 Tax=Trifolium medium TaxID=97028 RepID=A0A392MI20_9FABA|nr:hypothetical protein [Trifolium medium]
MPEITAPQFEFKPIMFQMLQVVGQFSGTATEDPHLHLRQFMEVASNFKNPGITQEAFRLRLFPYSLRDRAKSWLNSLEPNSISTWNALAEKFLTKHFPPIKNARMRIEIISFRQAEDESLYEAWERFKELLRKCPHHGIPSCIQLETFYHGLLTSSRYTLDTSAGGAILEKSYNKAFNLIEKITTNTYQWYTTRSITPKKVVNTQEVNVNVALVAEVAKLTHMLWTMCTATSISTVKPMHVVSDPSPIISCVYCGGAHSYADCPSNPNSMNHMQNFNMDNNLYSNTYNHEWENHPIFFENQGAMPPPDSAEYVVTPDFTAAPNYVEPPEVMPPDFSAPDPQALMYQPTHAATPEPNVSLEATLMVFMSETKAFMNETKAYMNETKTFMNDTKAQFLHNGVAWKNMEDQVGQLATSLSVNHAPKNKETCKAISLRSGK